MDFSTEWLDSRFKEGWRFISFYFLLYSGELLDVFFVTVILKKKSETEWQGQKDQQQIKTIAEALASFSPPLQI